jgi:hypothetical protein
MRSIRSSEKHLKHLKHRKALISREAAPARAEPFLGASTSHPTSSIVASQEPRAQLVLREATVSFFLPQLDGYQDTISLAVRFPRRRDPNETTNECVDMKGTLFRR